MNFDLIAPANVAEAVSQMLTNPGARYISGGTDLIPNLRRGIGAPDVLIGLDGIDELKIVDETDTHVVIGATVTLAALAETDLPDRFPALGAVAEVAGPALRQAATVGGNLCLDTRCLFYNQSKWWRKANRFCLKLDGDICHVAPNGNRCHAAFSGDLAPALLVLGAEIKIAGKQGQRWKPLNDLYREDGLAHLALSHEDLLVAVRIPVASSDLRSGYLKSRLRKAVDFPLAGVAVALKREGNLITALRIAVTGTNSRPLLFEDFAEVIGQELNEERLTAVAKQIGQLIKPMRTTNLPGLYRRQMAGVLVRRLLTGLYEGAGRGE